MSTRWTAASFGDPSDFSVDLDAADRRELVAAVKRQGIVSDERRVALTRADFALMSLGAKLDAAYKRVRDGCGFVLLRGLPRHDLDLDAYTTASWAVGTHFGQALSQNAAGERISHVVDATKTDATPRMYRSNIELRLHTDICAMFALACWNKAASGGISVLTSSLVVHDEIERRAPRLLKPLYDGFHYHRFGEEADGEEPVTPWRVPMFTNIDGSISCRYLRSALVAGHRDKGIPISDAAIEGMDLFDQIAQAEDNRLSFEIEPGEMIFANNYTVLHARTAFTNNHGPGQERRLIRLWLDAPNFRKVPATIHHFRENGIPPAPGKRATLDVSKVYRDDPKASGGVAKLNVGRTGT